MDALLTCENRPRLDIATGCGIEYDELWTDLAGALPLQQRYEAAEVLQVECVHGARGDEVVLVSDHGAVKTGAAAWRLRDELTQAARVWDV